MALPTTPEARALVEDWVRRELEAHHQKAARRALADRFGNQCPKHPAVGGQHVWQRYTAPWHDVCRYCGETREIVE